VVQLALLVQAQLQVLQLVVQLALQFQVQQVVQLALLVQAQLQVLQQVVQLALRI